MPLEFSYQCQNLTNTKSGRWTGHVRILHSTAPYEIKVNASGSSFHIIIGKHDYGNYICIPDWNIGTSISGLSDTFWNFEHLVSSYPELSSVDASSITKALCSLAEYIDF